MKCTSSRIITESDSLIDDPRIMPFDMHAATQAGVDTRILGGPESATVCR
jgi:hypothetical protein